MSKSVYIILGALVLIAAGFFGYKYFSSGKTYTSVTAPSIPVATNTVSIKSNSFDPDAVTVKVGTKVTWINSDSYAHTITADNGAFDSGNLDSGQSFAFTFTKAGTYDYHCTIHTFMTAKIVVTE